MANNDIEDPLPRTIALNPSILSEDEAVQLFSKVLDHVISLRFTVNEEVETDLLLETNDDFNLFLDEIFVLFSSKLSLS